MLARSVFMPLSWQKLIPILKDNTDIVFRLLGAMTPL
jgi:hypothetical protein